MAEVAEVTYRYFVYLHEINGILAPLLALLSIVVGTYANYQDAADFILTGSSYRSRFTTDAPNVGMARVLMTHRDNTSGRFAQGIAQVR